MFVISKSCPYCDELIDMDLKEYVIDSEVIDEDRGMGFETEHVVECDEYECPECGRSFGISGSIFEYPEGAYNSNTIKPYTID